MRLITIKKINRSAALIIIERSDAIRWCKIGLFDCQGDSCQCGVGLSGGIITTSSLWTVSVAISRHRQTVQQCRYGCRCQ